MKTSYAKSVFQMALFFAVLIALLGTQLGVIPAYASSITVNSNADTSADDGTCTLREAVANATSNSQLYASAGECAAGAAGSDTISFDSGLSGSTIYLASTLTLNSDMTIDGSSLTSQITISGDSDNNGTGDVQVFSVSTGTIITLNSLTLTKGAFSGTPGGGGIYNPSGATLTITNSTLSSNTNAGGPGGGIRNDGTLTVTNSTFSGNTTTTAGSGGGIRNVGTLTVTNSTFSGNSAAGSGGGIYNVAGFVAVTITNSTFSGNSAGSSGGGIYTSGGTFNYANTIIGNSLSGGDCAADGTIGTNINNLVEDASCSATTSGDPVLESLANNGGPNQTFALIAGSSAIDQGDATICAAAPVNNLDQRGITRPVGGQCDIGAYEGSVPDVVAPSVTTFTVTNPSPSLSIPITAFTTSDNVAVTDFLITETSTQPGTGDSGWSNSLPSTYTVNSLGDYTLYPWAKDAVGNVSSVYGTPATVTVCNASTTVTSSANSGAGSLRQAITDTCAGGTIDFGSSLAGTTIHLASSLTLSKNVTIDGSGLTSQITISGDNAVRVFLVNTGVTATLNSLAITNGSNFSGGGVRNDGTLTITNSTLSDNLANSGGGIFNNNSGTLTVTNSTFSGNSATSVGGGGIHNQGTLTITNSTLSANSASGFGGGIYNNGGTLNYANTILANSTTGGDCVNGGTGTIGTNTNNLVEDASCSASLSGDPNLGSLADNGGPTQTFALLTGSPAINAGDNTICAAAPVNNLDQRGVARPQGGQCDIGAYEYQTIVTSNADSGAGTLRQAIADAVSGDTIIFDSSLSGSTIYLASTLNIVQNMTIDGSALASKITLSGDSDNNGSADVRVIFVHSGMTVTLDSLIITKGNGTGTNMEDSTTGGGGIQNNSGNNSGVVLTIKNSVISGSSADTGGGIYNRDQSTLTITDSSISGNSATGNGGGIYSDGTLTVATSTISGNSAGGEGGGIRDGSITTLTNSTIANNSATGSGGGIRNAGNLTAKNNTIAGNSSSGTGGGIYSDNIFNATNNIFANATVGADCAGEIDININNLVEDGSCSSNAINFVTGDPSLGSLADNGGPTQTMALGYGSSAIDAGDSSNTCTDAPVSGVDQRGVARPVGAGCDIGAYEGATDIIAPTVSSSVRLSSSPSNGSNVYFTVTFSETVTGVDTSDFSVTMGGSVTGALVAGVSGSGTTRSVSVSSGAGDGTVLLNVLDDNTIVDAVGNPLNGAFTTGESYTIDKTAPTITINNPNTQAATSKTISASASESATLSQKNTTGSTCNGTLTFDPYASQVMTAEWYNGIKVCYKAVDTAGNVAYSLSNVIAGIDATAPTVISINRVTSITSAKASVQFLVTFSEAVTGITAADFSLTKTGITGESIFSISGSGASRTVTVNTGSGNGTLRLDIPNTATIVDQVAHAITDLPFTAGESYTINKTLTFTSAGFYDGWVLESGENTSVGGTLNSAATTFNVGDDAAKKQYRGILSFNTSSIPDTASISGVTLKVKQNAVVGAGSPVTIFGGFLIDIKTGFFANLPSLQASDFQAAASKTLGPASTALVSGFYNFNLVNGKAYINKLSTNNGLTQIRLRFNLDDNNNAIANYLSLFSGNAPTGSQPQLVITYSLP